ncbi:hypothetical protein J132_03869 [Termitomyces sp. J132]|nr:hypothetical protein J132_03869 [Termitomyces sp. J132]
MTDPDDCHANRNNRSLEQINTVVVPPLQLGPGATTSGSSGRPIRQLAPADDPFSMVIPETVLPEGWNAPLQNPLPRLVPPLPAPIQKRVNRLNQPIATMGIPETHLPEGWNAPLQNALPRMVPPLPVYERVNRLGPVNQPAIAQATVDIPETHLPERWDAPLQNPLPRLVPHLPAPIHGRVIKAPVPEPITIMMPPLPHTLALFQEQQRLKQRQQEQALAALQEQQRLRHIALAEEQKRQQEEALAVLQEQQRLRQIAIAEEQERQQQALAILSQEREREEEEQFMPEHIDLNPEHRPLNAAMAQRIFQGWQQQHEADLKEDFNDLDPQNDIPSEDDLEYVDPVQQRPAEQLDPPLDVPLGPQDDIPSDDDLEYVDPAGHQPAEQMDPPLDVPLDLQKTWTLLHPTIQQDYRILLYSLLLSFLFHHSLVLFSLFQEEGNLT